jgi:hypothetical protein
MLAGGRLLKVFAATGIESGYLGFAKQGRASLKGEAHYRLPFNPINMTLGFSRVRVNPTLSLAAQASDDWTDFDTLTSHKNHNDVTAGARYDIPVSDRYLLRLDAKANYGSALKKLQYQYHLSLGYIAGNTVRIAASYQQGYQEVSYVFDRELVLNFIFDVLNTEAAR